MRVHRLRSRLRSESGIGLVELLIAMTILSVAISAQLGVFGSSFASIQRAGLKGTALTLADKQMEVYRRVAYTCIYLTSATGDSAYAGDSAYSASQIVGSSCSPETNPPTTATTPSQTVVGPDNRTYRVDTYIVYFTPTSGRQERKVTVVVRRVTAGVVGDVLAR
jgi:type II secretory pathway pseudopilin PulG